MNLLVDNIVQPLMSEKSSQKELAFNEYCIVVHQDMTKLKIREAVTKVFGVVPTGVRTVNFRKKTRKTKHGIVPASSYKKAWVRLPEGKRLELK